MDSSSRWSFVPRAGAGPVEIARSEGAFLYTTDGRRILDAAGGAIVCNIGHGRREVAEAEQTTETLKFHTPCFPSKLLLI